MPPDWMVLGLKPEEKPDLQKKLGVKMSYVSGELHHYIRYCAQYNSDLARVIHDLVGWAALGDGTRIEAQRRKLRALGAE